MNIKTFLLGFIIAYFLFSLPFILGFGNVIDWVSEVTFFQKFRGVVLNGLGDNYLIKVFFSIIVGILFSFLLTLKRKNK